MQFVHRQATQYDMQISYNKHLMNLNVNLNVFQGFSVICARLHDSFQETFCLFSWAIYKIICFECLNNRRVVVMSAVGLWSAVLTLPVCILAVAILFFRARSDHIWKELRHRSHQHQRYQLVCQL